GQFYTTGPDALANTRAMSPSAVFDRVVPAGCRAKETQAFPEYLAMLSDAKGTRASTDTWLAAARTALGNSEPERCKVILEACLEGDPRNVSASLLLSRACLELESAADVEEGVALARSALSNAASPDDVARATTQLAVALGTRARLHTGQQLDRQQDRRAGPYPDRSRMRSALVRQPFHRTSQPRSSSSRASSSAASPPTPTLPYNQQQHTLPYDQQHSQAGAARTPAVPRLPLAALQPDAPPAPADPTASAAPLAGALPVGGEYGSGGFVGGAAAAWAADSLPSAFAAAGNARPASMSARSVSFRVLSPTPPSPPPPPPVGSPGVALPPAPSVGVGGGSSSAAAGLLGELAPGRQQGAGDPATMWPHAGAVSSAAPQQQQQLLLHQPRSMQYDGAASEGGLPPQVTARQAAFVRSGGDGDGGGGGGGSLRNGPARGTSASSPLAPQHLHQHPQQHPQQHQQQQQGDLAALGGEAAPCRPHSGMAPRERYRAILARVGRVALHGHKERRRRLGADAAAAAGGLRSRGTAVGGDVVAGAEEGAEGGGRDSPEHLAQHGLAAWGSRWNRPLATHAAAAGGGDADAGAQLPGRLGTAGPRAESPVGGADADEAAAWEQGPEELAVLQLSRALNELGRFSCLDAVSGVGLTDGSVLADRLAQHRR
ncbi:hypothetical protein TSOC_009542, partial [Tetrabaena socialis]